MNDKFTSRKFMLAVGFFFIGSIALLAGKLSGGEYIGLSATVLGLYGGTNYLAEKAKNGH